MVSEIATAKNATAARLGQLRYMYMLFKATNIGVRKNAMTQGLNFRFAIS